jgi:F-type H+-transporting ATPase subunit b
MLFFFFVAGTALASSGNGENGGDSHGAYQGWVSTDTYRIMCFVVLAGALFFLLKKPVPTALNARIKGIRDQLTELEIKKRSAEKQLSQCNEKLSLLNEEAEKIIAGYIQQGEEARTRIILSAESTAEKLENQARRNIEHEFQKAKVGLQAEIIGRALAKAEQIIKKRISVGDQNRLVDEYLNKVVA